METTNGVLLNKHIDFTTEFKHRDEFLGPRSQKFHIILPDGKEKWDFRNLLTLLNELNLNIGECRYVKDFKRYCSFTFFADDFIKLIIHVDENLTPSVEASLEFIFLYMKLINEDILTDRATQNRKYKVPRKKTMTRFGMHWKLQYISSCAILNSYPMGFYNKDSFSKPFRWFVKRIFYPSFPFPLKKNFDNSFMFDYEQFWIKRKYKEALVNSSQDFMDSIVGFLNLTLTKYHEKDNLPTMKINNELYTILDGIYISPFVLSLFKKREDLIHGLLMDTTWKIINKFVTSILMISIRNVGFPIAYAFGPAEDKVLYEKFIKQFKDLFDIDLKGYIVQSDQGSALKSVCDAFKNHIACLRHFLVSLKAKPFSFQIGQIIKCKCIKDLNAILMQYSEDFAKIEDPSLKKQLDQTLEKIGMIYKNGVLVIANQNKWEKVSMIERIKMSMPSTTNSLEATHGHLNDETPRRNDFWSSLYRLAKSLLNNDFNLNEKIKHSYNNQIRKTRNREKRLPKEEMEKEIRFYATTENACQCGETALLSSMLHIDIPCSHRLHLGAHVPELPDIDLKLVPCTNECVFRYTIVNRDPPDTSADHINWLKNNAVATIKRYSHYKHKTEISKFVDDKFNIGTEFVNEKPLGYYSLVNDGIIHFHKIQNQKEYEKQLLKEDDMHITSSDATDSD